MVIRNADFRITGIAVSVPGVVQSNCTRATFRRSAWFHAIPRSAAAERWIITTAQIYERCPGTVRLDHPGTETAMPVIRKSAFSDHHRLRFRTRRSFAWILRPPLVRMSWAVRHIKASFAANPPADYRWKKDGNYSRCDEHDPHAHQYPRYGRRFLQLEASNALGTAEAALPRLRGLTPCLRRK